MNPIFGHPEFRAGDPVSREEIRRLARIAAGLENATVTGVGATGADGVQILAPPARPAFWARITGPAGAAYGFTEVYDAVGVSTAPFQTGDVSGGMTGTAHEVNNNPNVPTGAVVWVVASEANEAWEFRYAGQLSLNVNIFSTPGTATWAKPANLVFAEIEVIGGGGPGGAVASAGAGQYTVSAGGGAGGYAYRKLNAASLGATETVTVGAGGTAGTGGTSSFGAWASATGGTTGAVVALNTGQAAAAQGGAGGVGSSGDLNIQGGSGGDGLELFDGTNIALVAGVGGASVLGGSPLPGAASIAGYGVGGSGRTNHNASGLPGQPGLDGVVIIREWTVV